MLPVTGGDGVRGGPHAAWRLKDAWLLEHRFTILGFLLKVVNALFTKNALITCLHIYKVHCMQTREIADNIHEIIHIYNMKLQIEYSNQYCNTRFLC